VEDALKVIHLISGGDSGGAKTHVLSLLTELNKTIDADLVCFMRSSFTEEAQALGIPLTVFDKSFADGVRRVRKMVDEGGYDVIHCHGSRANLIGAILKRHVDIPVISTVHSDYRLDYMGRPGAAITYGRANAWALRRLDYRVCVSEQMRQILIDRGFEPNRIFTIHNGIDFSKPVPRTDRKTYFEKIGCPFSEDDVIAGIAARLDPVKDVGTLIRGYAKAHEKCPRLKLMIAGDGMELEKLKALTKELGVEEQVFFAGWVKDMNSFYGALDINTLTSLSEGFPYAIPEGARAHLPTVSSAVGGVSMLVRHGQTGMLFEPGDADTLGEELAALASDPEKRALMGDAIFQKGAEDFSTETTCRTQLEIYDTVLRRETLKRTGGKEGVVICGAYGHGNSGDEAILEAIVGEMRALDKYMPITVLSRKPRETQKLRGVNAVYRFNYPKFKRAMAGAKLYINGGGSLIQNVTSRRSLEYYLYTIKMAKRLGCSVIMYGCGIGPVNNDVDIARARRIINDNVDVITLREPNSLEELRRFGIDRPEIILASDPAMNLPAAEDWEVDAFMRANGMEPGGKYICFALRRWPGFESHVPDFAAAARYAYRQLKLIPVFLTINHQDDVKAAERVIELLDGTPYFLLGSAMGAEMTIGFTARMEAVVSMRLHGLIFAAGQGVPLVGISYDPKVAAFIDYIGQGPCMGLDDVTEEGLTGAIASAIRRSGDREARIVAAQRLRTIEKKNVQAAAKLLQ
jgi:polysaccharide pyruvyl transferase CsaB